MMTVRFVGTQYGTIDVDKGYDGYEVTIEGYFPGDRLKKLLVELAMDTEKNLAAVKSNPTNAVLTLDRDKAVQFVTNMTHRFLL